MLLQEVHTYGLLVVPGEDALAVALDHTGLAHCAVAHYHHLKMTKCESLHPKKNLLQCHSCDEIVAMTPYFFPPADKDRISLIQSRYEFVRFHASSSSLHHAFIDDRSRNSMVEISLCNFVTNQSQLYFSMAHKSSAFFLSLLQTQPTFRTVRLSGAVTPLYDFSIAAANTSSPRRVCLSSLLRLFLSQRVVAFHVAVQRA